MSLQFKRIPLIEFWWTFQVYGGSLCQNDKIEKQMTSKY